MPTQGGGLDDPERPAGDLDARLADKLGRVRTLEELTAALQREADVARAGILPGLVKTHPPIVELLIEQRQDDGTTVRWTYDLVAESGGRMRVRSRHPG
jgi:hypothetical protein